MSKDERSETLGRFKTRFLELEDSVEHTLTHASVCELANEAKEEFTTWADSEPSLENGYILQAETEQRTELLKETYASWIEEGKELIRKWFGLP